MEEKKDIKTNSNNKEKLIYKMSDIGSSNQLLEDNILRVNAMTNVLTIKSAIYEMVKTFKNFEKICNGSQVLKENMIAVSAIINSQAIKAPIYEVVKALKNLEKIGSISQVLGANMLGVSAMTSASNTINIEKQIQKNINSLRKQLRQDKIKDSINDSNSSSTIDSCEKNININNDENMELDIALNDTSIYICDCGSLQDKINNILIRFKKTNSVFWIMICFFILSPIQSYYNALCKELITSAVNGITISESNTNNKNKLEKRIKYEVKKNIVIYSNDNIAEKDILKKYRLVTTTNLNVRLNHSIKSRAIDTLKFGQVVTVVYKNKNWTLIEFTDNTTSIQGWVFTRYISKF